MLNIIVIRAMQIKPKYDIFPTHQGGYNKKKTDNNKCW